MKYIAIFLLLSTFIPQTNAQKTIKPILIDKTSLSGIGLQQLQLKQEPNRAFFQKQVYAGQDLSVFIVSSQSWPGQMNNFPIDEYIYMLNGKARVKPEGGENKYFHTGDHFYATKGFTGEWEIMAGDHYHYELSVITTERAPASVISKEQDPALLSKNELSGTSIDLRNKNKYEKTLFKGDELQISLRAEIPGTAIIENPLKEHVISLLSGQLILTDDSGQTHHFQAGDFLIIPRGLTGKWEGRGHGLCKYLVVEKSM